MTWRTDSDCNSLGYSAQAPELGQQLEAALHAEQDANQMKKQPITLADAARDPSLLLSADERLARTVLCGECGARPGDRCRLVNDRIVKEYEASYVVSWSDPTRPFHGTRLEAARRAQTTNCAHRNVNRYTHTCGCGMTLEQIEALGQGFTYAEPAASSGFQAPKSVWEVECPLCKAPGRALGEIVGMHDVACKNPDGRAAADIHQLRIDRFEAMREQPKFPRPKPAPRKLCSVPKCGRPVEHSRAGGGVAVPNDAPPEMIAAALRETQANRMCGDHAEMHMRAPKIAQLRSDLGRPLPRALTTWPEAWSSATGESDR